MKRDPHTIDMLNGLTDNETKDIPLWKKNGFEATNKLISYLFFLKSFAKQTNRMPTTFKGSWNELLRVGNLC